MSVCVYVYVCITKFYFTYHIKTEICIDMHIQTYFFMYLYTHECVCIERD